MKLPDVVVNPERAVRMYEHQERQLKIAVAALRAIAESDRCNFAARTAAGAALRDLEAQE